MGRYIFWVGFSFRVMMLYVVFKFELLRFRILSLRVLLLRIEVRYISFRVVGVDFICIFVFSRVESVFRVSIVVT